MASRTGHLRAALAPLLLGGLLCGLDAGIPGAGRVHAQTEVPTRTLVISGDRLSGFVLPIEPRTEEIVLTARQAWRWDVDDTRRVLLRGNVSIAFAGNFLTTEEAVLWLNRIPSADGVITQMAIYFDRVSDPTQKAGVGPHGSDLLLTASTRGGTRMRVSFTEEERPGDRSIIARGEARLATHLRQIVGAPPPLGVLPDIDRPAPPPERVPMPGEPVAIAAEALPGSIELPLAAEGRIFDPTGLVAFSGGSIEIDEQTDRVVVDDGLIVDYLDEAARTGPRRLTLTARRGVIFLGAGTVRGMREGARRVAAEQVQGIYLEGDVVASDGNYTMRGTRVYYDVALGRATVAEAVLRTYIRDGRVPIVARAEEMRQLSIDQWIARRAVLSTSDFFTPHLAVGADEVTVDRMPGAGEDRVVVSATDTTMRAGGVPFFWWPHAVVEGDNMPIRALTGGYSDRNGAELETEWDLLALLGVDGRERLDATLEVDGFTERGAGLGTRLKYDFLGRGALDLYGLYDEGTDETSAGRDVEPSTEWRGYAVGEHRLRLDRTWTLDLNLSWISDETFITSWRRDDFAERREYETSIAVLRQEDNHALTGVARYDLNDFISNEWLLGSRGYTVERLPEGTYRRYGDVLFDSITWTQEWRASRLRLLPTSGTPRSLGVPEEAFGLASADTPIKQLFRDRGISSGVVGRLDTRHELSLPFDAGPVRLVPFGTGRFTGYTNDEFETYSSDAEDLRYFLAGGLRASTQFQRVYDGVENRLLDLHRVRHIMEPRATLWYGWSNAPRTAYPIYDQDVEGIGDGTSIELALRNTIQTQRGGPGRWRSVDALVVDLGGVLSSDDSDKVSAAPRWFGWRPEYSNFGDHLFGSGVWTMSDAIALTGSGTWDLDADDLAFGSVGMDITHTPDLRTYCEYRTIESERSRLLEFGWDYQLTRKYRAIVAPQIDLREGQFRALNVGVIRSFPDFDFIVRVGYDEITDETTFAASLRPGRF